MSAPTITSETTIAQLEAVLRERRAFVRVRLWGPEVRTSFDATRSASLAEKLSELFDRHEPDETPDPVRLAVERLRDESVGAS